MPRLLQTSVTFKLVGVTEDGRIKNQDKMQILWTFHMDFDQNILQLEQVSNKRLVIGKDVIAILNKCTKDLKEHKDSTLRMFWSNTG